MVFLDDAAFGPSTSDGETRARALGLELAGLGFVPTQKLTAAFARLAAPAAAEQHAWICEMHAELAGANKDWTPLFYSFPDPECEHLDPLHSGTNAIEDELLGVGQ